MYQQLWGYKVEEKLYLGVREQKRLNTTVNIIGIGQKLMCPIQYQSLLVLLDPPDGIFKSKVEKQW
jgi:hypothetical protein